MTAVAADAIVVGGGVIGKATALALSERGAKVTIFDAAGDRRPATRAAAGILGAQMEAHSDGPLTRLCLASRDRFAAFARDVEAKSGREVEFRTSGVTIAAFDEAALAKTIEETAWQKGASLALEVLDRKELHDLEPELAKSAVGGVRFRDDPRVDPRKLLDALDAALANGGVEVRRAKVERVLRDGARAIGVTTSEGEHPAKHVVLAAGSWSTLVGASGLDESAVIPARGQMLELRAPPGLLRGVVLGPDAYFSPRDDGRILVGSTVELVGFDDRTTEATKTLHAAALRCVPALATAALTDSWAGLRPYTLDELPLIGPAVLDRLIFATGHFRNGVLLAPITADIVADLVEGKAPAIGLAPFSPARLARMA